MDSTDARVANSDGCFKNSSGAIAVDHWRIDDLSGRKSIIGNVDQKFSGDVESHCSEPSSY